MNQRVVRIVGGPQLQNRLLSNYLAHRLDVSCSVISHSRFSKDASEQDLFLIDYQENQLEPILEILFPENILRQINVAIFKVPADACIDHLISQPQLKGVFYDTASEQQLTEGIKAIFAGELWLPRKYLTTYVQSTRKQLQQVTPSLQPEVLTQRELEVLEMLCSGARNNEIAINLHLSPHTVKTHLSNIFRKIDASNRLEAVNWARDNVRF